MTLLEAQACEVPVVASNVGSVSEAVSSQSAILVEAGNSDVLADALLKSLTTILSENPREFIVRERSMQQMLNKYSQLVAE